MKTFSWKKIGLGVAVIGIIAFGIFYFTTSTGSKPGPSYINPAFGEYISSYTAGVVSSGTTVRIVLATDVVDSSLIGQENPAKLFSFSPSIDGKTVWLDRRTVEFRPDKRLISGQIYEVSFGLSKLMPEVAGELSTFAYTFQVMPQNFEIGVDNVKPYVKTELKRQKIEGNLYTADFAETDVVEKMLTPRQEGNTLKITWTHNPDGKQHAFVVEDVARKDKASEVTLSVQGKPLGIDRDEDKVVEIPSLGDFKLMQARVVQHPNQYVVLQFSDPLKEKQDLTGLISMAEAGTLDFEIRDNEINVYPPVRQTGSKVIRIEAGIRNILDYKMKDATTTEVVFEQVSPAVRFAGKGSILPSSDGMVLPFEAVNLKSVDVTILKIFERNVLQFLQVNGIQGEQELQRVGRKILKTTVQLDNAGVTDLGKWNRYTLDLSKLISTEPGAIYQVKLSFKRQYSTYTCEGGGEEEEVVEESVGQFEDEESNGYYDEEGYYYEDDYYYEDYDWEERDNPCHSSYYTNNRAIKRNVLASDLGITAKRGDDGTTLVFVNDLKTTQPLSGTQLELYDYQQQLIGSATTDSEGKATILTKETPFALIAKNGQQRGYQKLTNGDALSVSNFDVTGEVIQRGLKGFLYGDRGVWRPGDSLYLTFILEDKNKQLPATHPVVFEMQNPQGQVVNRLVRSGSENGFYSFATATAADAPTGNWTGRVKVGGTEFTQTLKIETVKPNRLKINLDFGTDKFTSSTATGKLDVKWLHGAPGRNLKAEFDMLLLKAPTTFAKYPDYVFEDPAREFYSEAQPVFEGITDEEGKATVNVSLESTSAAPGFLTAVFRGKVFEESGNFSIDRFSIPYYPYESYIGMKAPEGEKYSGILYFDKPHTFNLVTLDETGQGISRDDIEVSVYKLGWRWWWDNSEESIANYLEGSYSKLVKSDKARTVDGKGNWTIEMKMGEYEYGRYFVRACDPVSGHCTGQIIYVDEPGWYSRARDDDDSRGGATMLSFTTDKTNYNIGEKVNVTIPSSAPGGRALVSLENGSRVLKTYWVETQQGETKFSFDTSPDMAPNIYVHVSLLQPHAQTVNDLPIRLYGVSSIRVEDPKTHLEPVIAMPEELEPGKEVTIKISEKTNRKMTYTIAVVDEGLLDITRFKTPDAWSRFYAREALGVRTWDVFDDVMGAFGARLERLLAIGGDAELAAKEDDARANRFKPVVKYFGPYTLNSGTNSHTFVMPQYIGSVKTMVVAGYEGAYGKAEKATPVRKPLMVLATLPRVLGPEETVKLPITLFTQEKGIKNVKIEVKVSGPLRLAGDASQSVAMPASGDLTVDFDLAVKAEAGIAKVEVTASSGKFQSTDVIEIEVRNPNTPVTKVTESLLEAGKSWAAEAVPFGITGTNTAIVEVSNLPPINLGSRLKYLIQYPHGCIEQTTSSVLPQLYLAQVKELTELEKKNIQRNVTAGIERLKSFIQSDGGFGYWPGPAEHSDPWGTTYAGHFLVDAEAKGYYVPADMLKRWKKYQKNKAQEWRRNDNYYNNDLMQAYRLYTLALAGAPEMGAMNRLRELGNLNTTSAWMLAAAYAKAGQPEAATKLIANLSTTVKPYRELSYSYGSDVRDKALILETLAALNDKTKAFAVLKEISKYLGDYGYWMSTQETAFCLKAIGAFAGMDKRGALKFSYVLNGKTVQASTELPVAQVAIPLTGLRKESVKITNESGGMLFTRLIMEGTPARGAEEDAQSNLTLNVRYTDTDGKDLDVTRLEQGTEFLAEVTVIHNGTRSSYENLALSQVFPSGWEINNLRITDDEGQLANSAFQYQDIRDDRVYTYFNLSATERKTFHVMLTAGYAGSYYLPAVNCEAMYDKSIYARKKGQVVEVVKGSPAQ